jgi:hypothetical protein
MSNNQTIKNYKKAISPAAQRALKEAEERRKLRHKKETELAEEKGGPKGAEPTRYGDWERNGIAYDF